MTNTQGLTKKEDIINEAKEFPAGFNSRSTDESDIWGILNRNNGYSMITTWIHLLGGKVKYATKDNKVNMQLDGMLYQNNGEYQVVDCGSSQVIEGYKEFRGNTKFTEIIDGTCLRALNGDLAECYISDKQYEEGTLVQFGGEKEITIATDKVNAVVSSKPGLILNGKIQNGLIIALTGRVYVKVVGKVNKFDDLILSDINGVAVKGNGKIIAKALEDKNTEEIGLVLCVTRLEL